MVDVRRGQIARNIYMLKLASTASRVRTAIQPWSQQARGVQAVLRGYFKYCRHFVTETIDAVMARSQQVIFRLEWAQVCLLWG